MHVRNKKYRNFISIDLSYLINAQHKNIKTFAEGVITATLKSKALQN